MILIADSGATKTDWCFGTTLHHMKYSVMDYCPNFHALLPTYRPYFSMAPAAPPTK